MKTEKMQKVIAKAIKAATEEAPVNREALLIELLTAGAKASTAMAAITKAFKEAGIISQASTSSLKDCREHLKENMPELDTYRAMRLFAVDMNDQFKINTDDEEKGIASAIKLIKEQLKEDSLPVPKKIHLGVIKALMVDYFLDHAEADVEAEDYVAPSVEALTEYLIENVDVEEKDMNDEMKKKLKVTAGTDYNFAYMLVNGLRLEDVN